MERTLRIVGMIAIQVTVLYALIWWIPEHISHVGLRAVLVVCALLAQVGVVQVYRELRGAPAPQREAS